MPTHKVADLAVKVSEYTDRNSGQTKGRYQNVGALMQGDDGSQFIMLAKWFNPAGVPDFNGRGGESVAISCFTPKDPSQAGQAPQGQGQARPAAQGYGQPAQQPQGYGQPPAAASGLDDDLPF